MEKEKLELETKLADYGIRQFVRTTICQEIMSSTKPPIEVIADINEKLLEDFTTISRDESRKVFEEIKEKLKKS